MTTPARLARYVSVMFPPVLALLGGAAFLSTWLALQALAGLAPLHVGADGVVGTLTAALWMALVRFLDDLHDAPHDRRLAAAGDPRYTNRPTVTGAITIGEVRLLAAAAAAGMIGLNLLPGSGRMAIPVLAGLALTWLGFQWFFIPALAHHPSPLAYLLRKSLAVLIGVYAVLAFRDRWPGAALVAWMVPLVAAPAFEVAAWETARKIRLPDDETTYATYSKQFGWRRAALVPALFASLAALCLATVGIAAGLGAGYAALVVASAGVVAAAGFRLRAAPTGVRTRLEPFARFFGGVAHAGLIAALTLRHGLAV